MPRLVAFLGLFVALVALPAAALVLAAGDGTGNTQPPPRDPGWARFATKAPCPPQCGLTYLYLGNGWMLSAWHATAQDMRFFASNAVHPHVPGSAVRVGGKGVDLLLFRIQDAPPLPLLPISARPPRPGERVLMVGGGLTRGEPLPGDPTPGWGHRQPAELRWGTNRVVAGRFGLPARFPNTRAFATRFDWPGTPEATRFEAQAVVGDSGGAVFVVGDGRWQLAGTLIAATPALYGRGVSLAADLSHYRDEILAVVAAAAANAAK